MVDVGEKVCVCVFGFNIRGKHNLAIVMQVDVKHNFAETKIKDDLIFQHGIRSKTI